MPFELSSVVPWGRSYQEYVAMFSLTDQDLRKKILGCGDGPASFNAELTRRGGSVVSADPLYQFSTEEIGRRIEETFEVIMNQTRANLDGFIWQHLRSVDELGAVRMTAMRDFLADFDQGRLARRYLPYAAPKLEFPSGSFDLALSSHFLFLYSDHFDLNFHLETLMELCRISAEVRVFPLLSLGGKQSPFVAPVTQHLSSRGYVLNVVRVPYEFQRGGNEMLVIQNHA